MAKAEYKDLVELIRCAFERLPPEAKLWRSSPQLLRNRFRQLLVALRLPATSRPDRRALDLGSMRAGGATHLQMLVEDAELTRRGGRWLSARTRRSTCRRVQQQCSFPNNHRRQSYNHACCQWIFTNAGKGAVLHKKLRSSSLAATSGKAQIGKTGRHGGTMDGTASNEGPVKQDRKEQTGDKMSAAEHLYSYDLCR